MRRLLCALVALLLPTASALAQTALRERVQLITANATTGPVQVYGGTYVVTQSCTTYGTVTVRYRDPAGAMLVLFTKTTADTGGGTQVTLGSDAVMDATVTGTAGCNVSAARVPS